MFSCYHHWAHRAGPYHYHDIAIVLGSFIVYEATVLSWCIVADTTVLGSFTVAVCTVLSLFIVADTIVMSSCMVLHYLLLCVCSIASKREAKLTYSSSNIFFCCLFLIYFIILFHWQNCDFIHCLSVFNSCRFMLIPKVLPTCLMF